jgi:hypothetical protein
LLPPQEHLYVGDNGLRLLDQGPHGVTGTFKISEQQTGGAFETSVKSLPWTPTSDNAGQKDLFLVISNIRSKAIDHVAKMTISKTCYFGFCHARLERLKNF